MKCIIAAVGALKKGPEAQLFEKYRTLLPWPLEVREIDVDAKLPSSKRLPMEAEKLRHAIRSKTTGVTFALDSRGKQVTSEQLASFIADAGTRSASQCAFLIGGQDGLDASLVKEAQHVIAFGGVTWPHQLLRAMLMEQLYRAYTISAGHPYHTGH
ncbi:MAG: 23S rRNA (pseudouridine(1915)-N(3))-methyltransferase RlmH [Alphaproteobacteria bacterium]|nr:23S rRNA (pseudouridine(1915)-N(3))-methyltransferase RlmH [Alphaproteobacteria bacterium]